MPSNHVPRLRRHAASSQAVVTFSRKDHYLGPWPKSLRKPPPEVKERYDRLIGEWLANGRKLPATAEQEPNILTVNELILRFYRWAESHYRRPDGTTTNELNNYRCACKPLKAMYGRTPAAEFGPLALKAVRQHMIDANREETQTSTEDGTTRKPRKPLCRNEVNRRTSLIKRMFKWAASEELVPPSAFHGLQAVSGLQKGRTATRESDPIKPVSDEDVDKVLPLLRPQVRAMVELQRRTGMRPGEVCALKPKFIDRTEAIWIFDPQQHKTSWKGKQRRILIGPKGQTVLTPFLEGRDPDAFVFSPAEAVESLRIERKANRKTKVQPSQMNRSRNEKPKRTPKTRYTVPTYGRAIGRACIKARLPEWAPNQLRHTYGTEVRKRFGLEAAQVTLGHSNAQVTQVYAERDLTLAEKVAAEIG